METKAKFEQEEKHKEVRDVSHRLSVLVQEINGVKGMLKNHSKKQLVENESRFDTDGRVFRSKSIGRFQRDRLTGMPSTLPWVGSSWTSSSFDMS